MQREASRGLSAERMGFNKVFSCSLLLYTEAVAVHLCTELCRRTQHLYEIDRTYPGNYVLLSEDKHSYQPPAAWEQFIAGLPEGSPAWERVMVIEGLLL